MSTFWKRIKALKLKCGWRQNDSISLSPKILIHAYRMVKCDNSYNVTMHIFWDILCHNYGLSFVIPNTLTLLLGLSGR